MKYIIITSFFVSLNVFSLEFAPGTKQRLVEGLISNIQTDGNFVSKIAALMKKNSIDNPEYLELLFQLNAPRVTAEGFEIFACDSDAGREMILALKDESEIHEFNEINDVLFHATGSIIDILRDNKLKQKTSDCGRKAVFFALAGFFPQAVSYLDRSANESIKTILIVKKVGGLTRSNLYYHETLYEKDFELSGNRLLGVYFPQSDHCSRFFEEVQSIPDWQNKLRGVSFFIQRENRENFANLLIDQNLFCSAQFCHCLLDAGFLSGKSTGDLLKMELLGNLIDFWAGEPHSVQKLIYLLLRCSSFNDQYLQKVFFRTYLEKINNVEIYSYFILHPMSICQKELINSFLKKIDLGSIKENEKLHVKLLSRITGETYVQEIRDISEIQERCDEFPGLEDYTKAVLGW